MTMAQLMALTDVEMTKSSQGEPVSPSEWGTFS
jgi:hypothetical protein